MKALIEGYYLPLAEKAAKLGGFSPDVGIYGWVRLRPLVKECFEDAVAPSFFSLLPASAVLEYNIDKKHTCRRR